MNDTSNSPDPGLKEDPTFKDILIQINKDDLTFKDLLIQLNKEVLKLENGFAALKAENERFGLCRDCEHWRPNKAVKESLPKYPRDKHPDDGWYDAVCMELVHNLEIEVSAGWNGGVVDSIETDSNFGCRYFKQKEEDNEQ